MSDRKTWKYVAVTLALNVFFGASVAAATTVSGYFNDPTNAALISSNGSGDFGPAQFGTDDNVARNVAVYQLTVTTAGAVQFTSSGYADGGANDGAQPYFSLFAGSGPTATFRDSSIDDANIDFSATEALDVGTYVFAIGVYPNMSSAENDPTYGDTLSQGFTALGGPGNLGNYFYQVDVTSDGGAFTVDPFAPGAPTGPNDPASPGGVPEPGTFALLGAGLVALRARRRHRRA